VIERNVKALFEDPSAHIVVARRDGCVVGFVNFTTRRTLIHPAPSDLIDELVVAPECRGQGIGEALVRAARDRCRGLGCCELEVSTPAANDGARRFYRRCGFDEGALLLEMDL
jgi:GNAT superfamily N-acetyltransferase